MRIAEFFSSLLLCLNIDCLIIDRFVSSTKKYYFVSDWNTFLRITIDSNSLLSITILFTIIFLRNFGIFFHFSQDVPNGDAETKILLLSLLFYQNSAKNSRKQNKTTLVIEHYIKQMMSKIMISLFFILLGMYNAKQYDSKQHLSNYIKKTNYLKTDQVSLILSIFSVCESERLDQGRSYSQNNINISNCIFTRYSLYSGNTGDATYYGSAGCGGVIFIDGGSFSMSVYDSSFFNCVASSDGGAIFFHNSPYSLLKNVCGNRCSCGITSYYNFGMIGGKVYNNADLCSVIQCSPYEGNGEQTAFFYNGQQKINSINTTNNRVRKHSGMAFWNIETRTVRFSSLVNNVATQGGCLCQGQNEFYSGRLEFSNFVNNSSPSYGVVYTHYGRQFLSNCIFNMNRITLFFWQYGSISVEDSYIDHDYSIGQYTKLECVVFTKSNTYDFTFYLCIDQTIRDTPVNTMNQSPKNTLDQTISATMNETPIISNTNNGLFIVFGIRIIGAQLFIVVTVIIIVILIVILFNTKGLLCLDDGSSTLDSLQESTFWDTKI